MSPEQDKYKKSGTPQPGGFNTDAPQDDPGFVSAETAARKDREGGSFGNTEAPGATVDKEGLTDIHAVEPEPYVEQQGDLGQSGGGASARTQEQGEGKLSGDSDTRGKGPGGI